MLFRSPLLDRIDLHIEVPRLSEEELLQTQLAEPSVAIRKRVCDARNQQAKRFAAPIPYPAVDNDVPPHPADVQAPVVHPKLFCNAQMGPAEIRAYCHASEPVRSLLRAAIQQLNLSARAYDRLLKVARTIADLEGDKEIATSHIAEAIQYRSLARKYLGG